MKKILAIGNCPKCKIRLIVKIPERLKRVKPIQCKKCGYIINQPTLIFNPMN